MLRKWQAEAVNLSIEKYLRGQQHILLLATPGAGKSVAAAEIGYRLKQSNEIDFILCFSPSLIVAEGMRTTFSYRFNASFHGSMGAVGGSYTYQNMLYLSDDFWQILENHNVLVVFDEIHHCSGSDVSESNAWGEKILTKIQSKAKYTLALTGTPWRSDFTPITLAKYTDPDNQIYCDYTYGLGEAVRDNVCRNPHLVLVDNNNFQVTKSEKGKQTFGSVSELLKYSSVNYESVITHPETMNYLLQLSCHKLAEVRKDNPEAAGLVVASSVSHAIEILNILKTKFKQTATIVTYRHDNPLNEIANFRSSNTQWIVSVGMISEGTDIPRLQVCCHLSTVKTELYFRQVLGRILRVTQSKNQDAWLFTIAEPKLTEFAERIDEDIPDYSVIEREIKRTQKANLLATTVFENQDKASEATQRALNERLEVMFDDYPQETSVFSYASNIALQGDFRQRVISVFNHMS